MANRIDTQARIEAVRFQNQTGSPAAPAAGYSLLYVTTNGLYLEESSGAVIGPFVTGTPSVAGGLVSYAYQNYTGGDIALTSTSPAAVGGIGDLVIAASVGDVLLIDISARTPNTTAQSLGLDVATIVSNSPVTFMSSRNGVAITTGRPAWFIPSGDSGSSGGSCLYVVQAGDISGGNVTLRLYARVSGNRTLGASGATPLEYSVTNLGQP